MTDALKLLTVTVTGTAISYVQPLHGAMIVLLVLFFGDMFFGILADLIVFRNSLSLKKFLLSFAYVAIYLSIITGIYFVGEKMGDEIQALFVDKLVTYVFIFFYAGNILKNLKHLLPKNQAIAFLEFLFRLEFVKKIPRLEEFLNKNKEKNNEV